MEVTDNCNALPVQEIVVLLVVAPVLPSQNVQLVVAPALLNQNAQQAVALVQQIVAPALLTKAQVVQLVVVPALLNQVALAMPAVVLVQLVVALAQQAVAYVVRALENVEHVGLALEIVVVDVAFAVVPVTRRVVELVAQPRSVQVLTLLPLFQPPSITR